MKETEKLIQILTKFGPRKLPLLETSVPNTGTLENQLYDNIKAGKYKSENEALLDLYESETDYHKYRMLKSRLKQKLFNELYFVHDESRPSSSAQKKCYDLMHQGKSLLLLTEYRLAEQPYKKALEIATRYEFTDNVIECLSNLNFIYSQLPAPKAFYQTMDSLKEYKKLKIIEDRSYEVYYSSKIELQRSVVHQKDYLKRMPPLILELKHLWNKHQSYHLFYHYYMLKGYYLDLTGDYKTKITEIKTCSKLLRNGKINKLRFPKELNQFLLPHALFKAKKYKEGLQFASQYLKEFNPYSRNWFAFMEDYFLLAMHDGKVEVCVEIIEAVNNNPYFERLKPIMQENWMLFKVFLSFYYPKFRYPMKYHQLSTAILIYSKDKLGHNISILILQFLWLLKNNEYEQLTSKEETFRKYANSYLKSSNSKRSYYLFKLMLIIIRVDFSPEKSLQKGQPWLEKLQNTDEPGGGHTSIEIIPYEKLWELMLGYLVRK